MTPEHIVLMAAYNASMNRKLYAAAASLPHAELVADRKAFFGSLLGTMNHLLAGDTLWLKRFAAHPAAFSALDAMRALPPSIRLSASFGDDLPTLRQHRLRLDDTISAWAAQVNAADLQLPLYYENSRGKQHKHFGGVVLHFFNHQTHHRGQASTLLSQAGVDIGITDLLEIIPDYGPPAP